MDPTRPTVDPTRPTVLVVDDEATLRRFLAENLTEDGLDVVEAGTAAEAYAALTRHQPGVVVLDVGLPDATGFEVCGRIRAADGIADAWDPATPVVFVSARAGETDRLRGYGRGGDHYLAKPFSYPELLAALRVALRRTGRDRVRRTITAGPIRIDLAAREVRVDGERRVLSGKEYALLVALAGEPTRVFTKDELLDAVWGFRNTSGASRTLDSHTSRLRIKLDAEHRGERLVQNVWGVGYRLWAP